MHNYLITGGAGFIGSHLAELLLQEGHKVRIVDNFSTGKRSNLTSILPYLEVYEGDLRNPECLVPALKGIDKVIHLAAIPSVMQSIKEPQVVSQNNIMGTLNLFETIARETKITTIVQASSSAVYGEPDSLPLKENQELQPLSPYAIDKVVQELYGSYYAAQYGLKVTSLRFFNVYGSRQDPTSMYAGVIPIFIQRVLDNLPPLIYGNGMALRDYIHVKDVARGIFLASIGSSLGHLRVNLGTGQGTRVKDLAEAILAIMGRQDLGLSYQEERKGEIQSSLADVKQAAFSFGFKAAIQLNEGIKELIDNNGKRLL